MLLEVTLIAFPIYNPSGALKFINHREDTVMPADTAAKGLLNHLLNHLNCPIIAGIAVIILQGQQFTFHKVCHRARSTIHVHVVFSSESIKACFKVASDEICPEMSFEAICYAAKEQNVLEQVALGA